jgi:hypothetical protein
MYDVIPAIASISPLGVERNQDRVAIVYPPEESKDAAEDGAAVVICDGVGSYSESGTVATEVASLITNNIHRAGINKGIWTLDETLTDVQLATANGATTAIAIGVEQSGLVSHAFIGNGSLLEIEPRKSSGGDIHLRWIDLALPHLSWEEGRPALRSFVPAPSAVFEVMKGCRLATCERSRMYLACSDGIATDEDRRQARTPRGEFWKSVPGALVATLQALEDQWPTLLLASPDDGRSLLRAALDVTLNTLLESGQLDDDASVACVLMRPSNSAKEGLHDA